MLFCAALFIGGCRTDSPDNSHGDFSLPNLPISESAITLEIGIIEIDASNESHWEQLQQRLDVQAIDVDQRRVLATNGFRPAVLPAQPPLEFWELIDPPTSQSDDEAYYQAKLRAANGRPVQKGLLSLQKVGLLPGQQHRIDVGPVEQNFSWQLLTRESGQENVRSGICELGQAKYNVSIFPNGESAVRLRLTPELHHGQPRNRITVIGDEFARQAQQEILPFYELAIDVPMRMGQSVIVGPGSQDAFLLGGAFFGEGSPRRAFYIRVTGANHDHLFSPTEQLRRSTDTF